jgi:hypothetical protein
MDCRVKPGNDEKWIASSQVLLAMTVVPFSHPCPENRHGRSFALFQPVLYDMCHFIFTE